MQAMWILSLIGLPLAAGLADTTGLGSRSLPSATERRRIDSSLAQFNFEPYILSDACFDCNRTDTTSLFSCSITCKMALQAWANSPGMGCRC